MKVASLEGTRLSDSNASSAGTQLGRSRIKALPFARINLAPPAQKCASHNLGSITFSPRTWVK
jgi:hypothetical protein